MPARTKTTTKTARKPRATGTTKARKTEPRSFTAEKAEHMKTLRAIARDYAPFRYRGIHPRRGRCACGGLAIRRLVFTGKYGKKLLLHPACADSLHLSAKA